MSYTYIASPYTHDDPEVMEGRYRAVRLFTAKLIGEKKQKKLANATVFSPIVHCHTLAIAHDLPHDLDFWLDFNEGMLTEARNLIILQLPSWKTSVGVSFEWGLAIGLKLSVIMAHPTAEILAELHSGTET